MQGMKLLMFEKGIFPYEDNTFKTKEEEKSEDESK